ncbi:MAG TPA: DNA translocase FtsK [Terriglobales bacterium]|nr:DNA translocase FtsK [Terriglobales bacterium]
MTFFSKIFAPGKNRRLNELIGFLLCVSALLLFLALASYSPLDPSLNSASVLTGSHAARNWIGILGAYLSDIVLQALGLGSFLLPVFFFMLGARWFRSRAVQAPVAKTLGAIWLLMFVPALLAILPGHFRWMGAIPIEGLAGRILGDVLIHYLNVAGAYIVCTTVLAVALYLTTAFSFSAIQVWAPTRFAFFVALRDRWRDWQEQRERARQQKELEKRRAEKPVVTAQLVPARAQMSRNDMARADMPRDGRSDTAREDISLVPSNKPARTGIERMAEEEAAALAPAAEQSRSGQAPSQGIPGVKVDPEGPADIEVTNRADSERKPKTTMPKIAGSYKLPPSSLLHRADEQQAVHEDELKLLAQVLTDRYAEFDVHGQVTQINPGPVVTTFEYKPEAGIKYSRITGLTDDLCLALRAESILVERMPGKSTVGIQVPNREREIIWLRENIESQEFIGSKSKLTLAMGKDINGRLAVADLAGMPHLLIAGSTGTGKSVAINAMIMSILYKSTPDQVRLVLVDPKRLELGNYEGVPHLYTPIITEPKLAANALRNAVREMERRLKLLAARGVRNIASYNALFDDTPSLFASEGGDSGEEGPIPYIVIIIDELADLMMLDGHNVEESITRLAQMARAVGIHLVLATQRPSVDVITGLIKANFPARISFRVATKVDSRTILDANGAESLLGRGDMLYLPSGSARVHRLHAPYVTEKEIAAVVEFWKAQGQAQYQEHFLETPQEEREMRIDGETGEEISEDENDPLFNDAVRLVIEFGKASTSLLQRRLRIGYGRAAHLIDLMERDGIVGAADGPKPREVLKRPDWISEIEESMR